MELLERLNRTLAYHTDKANEIAKSYTNIKTKFERIYENTCEQGKTISRILDTRINANFKDILEELAKIWETTPEKLIIEYFTFREDTFKSADSKSVLADQSFFFSIHNIAKNNTAIITAPIIMDSIQADGKRMKDHLTPNTEPNKSERRKKEFIIDDPLSLTLNFRFGDHVIKQTKNYYTSIKPTSKAILASAEKLTNMAPDVFSMNE